MYRYRTGTVVPPVLKYLSYIGIGDVKKHRVAPLHRRRQRTSAYCAFTARAIHRRSPLHNNTAQILSRIIGLDAVREYFLLDEGLVESRIRRTAPGQVKGGSMLGEFLGGHATQGA